MQNDSPLHHSKGIFSTKELFTSLQNYAPDLRSVFLHAKSAAKHTTLYTNKSKYAYFKGHPMTGTEKQATRNKAQSVTPFA